MSYSLILDLVIVLILLVGIYRGYKSGLLGGLIKLAGIVVGIFMAPLLVWEAEPYLPEALYAPIPKVILFIVAFVMVAGLVALAGKLVSKMVDWTPLGWIDKGIGSLAGFTLALLLVSVLLNLANMAGLLDAIPGGFSPAEKTVIDFLLTLAPTAFHVFRDWLPELNSGGASAGTQV